MSDTEAAPAAPMPPSSADSAHPLDSIIASIQAAVAHDATPEARAIGATACRSILTALEARAGQPLAATRPIAASAAPPTPPATPASPPPPIAALLAQLAALPRDKRPELLKQLATSPASPLGGILSRLAAMPREQLIEVINQQLRALAPAGTPKPPPAGPRFHMIPIPKVPRRGGEGP